MEEYIDTGKVYFEWRHFPLLGGEANRYRAPVASACAHEQESFWPFHDRIFEDIRTIGGRALGAEHLRSIAVDLDLDMAAFDSCVEEDRYRAAVQQDRREGLDEHGFRSTPSFLLNGQVVVGFYEFSAWDSTLQSMLEDGNPGDDAP